MVEAKKLEFGMRKVLEFIIGWRSFWLGVVED